MDNIELRLVAQVHKICYHGYIESTNTIYFLQAKVEKYGKWRTMDIVRIEDLPPDERLELDEACSRMVSSAPKGSAAK